MSIKRKKKEPNTKELDAGSSGKFTLGDFELWVTGFSEVMGLGYTLVPGSLH